MAPDRADDVCNDIGIHQTGRAAAEEDRVKYAARCLIGSALKLGKIGIPPSGLVDLAANVAVKVAIGTFRLAKWPMDIEAEAALLPIFSQNSPQSVSQRHPRGG